MKPVFGEEHGGAMHPNDLKSTQAVDDDALARIAENMSKVGGPPVVPAKPPEDKEELETEDDDLQDEAPEDDDLAADEDDLTPGAGDEEDADDKDADEKTPEIPDHLYRAAEHAAWQPEEIVDFWKSNPELAQRTLDKMHKDMVATNTEFAAMGRKSKELEQQAAAAAAVPAQVQKPAKPESFVDIEAARTEFGDGAAAVIQTLDQNLVALNEKLETVQAGHVAAGVTAKEAVADRQTSVAMAQQMQMFFSRPGMEPFQDFYGSSNDVDGNMLPDWSHLTPGQRANRQAAIDEASDIAAGVELRGASINLETALDKAHGILTNGIKTEIIRKDIMKSAKKRAKGVTLRPSQKKVAAKKAKLPQGHKMTSKQLLKNTQERLARLAAGKSLR